MVLTIDVGNTNIVIGGFVNHELKVVSRIATRTGVTDDEYAINQSDPTVLKAIEIMENGKTFPEAPALTNEDNYERAEKAVAKANQSSQNDTRATHTNG